MQFKVKGLPSLGLDERGLILPPVIQIHNGHVMFERQTEPQQFRFATLFWDKIARPQGFVAMGPTAEDKFLEAEGVVCFPTVSLYGDGSSGHWIKATYFSTLEAGEQSSPGRWSLARGPDSLTVLDELPNVRDIQFELQKAIPVPDKEVPLEEVLQFKRLRQPELANLRYRLREIYLKISTDPEPALGAYDEFRKLEKAISDHLRVSSEWRHPKRMITLGMGIGVGAAAMALTGVGVGTLLGLSGAPAHLLNLAAATISLRPGAAFQRRDLNSPYEYVARYHREVFV